jgi:hypothetical protein
MTPRLLLPQSPNGQQPPGLLAHFESLTMTSTLILQLYLLAIMIFIIRGSALHSDEWKTCIHSLRGLLRELKRQLKDRDLYCLGLDVRPW